MIVFCYHNGALGHATSALIECCTQEGGRDFPLVYLGENLHHFSAEQKLFCIKHPECNVTQEKKLGNFVISTSSSSMIGRFLILLMALKKWNNDEPEYNHRAVYKQHGSTYGEQLEILSLTLLDKVKLDSDWFVDTHCVLDILDYWNNVSNVVDWLINIGLTPIPDCVDIFCQQIAKSNQHYYNVVNKCVDVVKDTVAGKDYNIDLSFYEVAMCHAMLLNHYNKSHTETKLLLAPPIYTHDLRNIFQ
jgi:hypothetical protein